MEAVVGRLPFFAFFFFFFRDIADLTFHCVLLYRDGNKTRCKMLKLFCDLTRLL